MAWLPVTGVKECFQEARQVLVDCFPRQRRPGKTYHGFAQTSLRNSMILMALVQDRLRELLEETARSGGAWEVQGWVPLGVDGTNLQAPQTHANRRGLGCNGRGNTRPQVSLTMLLHLATGLPWAYEVGRADEAERNHLREMLHLLPARALLIADAGFSGYDLWARMLDLGQHFLLRVGSNVTLIQGLDARVDYPGRRVWLWPRGRRGRMPPLALRLIVLRDQGKTIHLVTSVLDQGPLSDDLAARFYHLRWGVELWFRSMKQTLDKRELRSRTPGLAKLEAFWAAAGLGVLGLLQAQALVEAGEPITRASTAGAARVVRAAIRCRPPGSPGSPGSPGHRRQGLMRLLARAVKDSYQRRGLKSNGEYPRKVKRQPPGDPKIRHATQTELLAYQRFAGVQIQ